MCGVEVEEYDVQPADTTIPLELALPGRETLIRQGPDCGSMCSVQRLSQAIATYQSEYFSGSPAITLNRFGEGKPSMLEHWAMMLCMTPLMGWALESMGSAPAINAPAGVEVAERWQGDQRLLFLLNHTDETVEVPVHSILYWICLAGLP